MPPIKTLFLASTLATTSWLATGVLAILLAPAGSALAEVPAAKHSGRAAADVVASIDSQPIVLQELEAHLEAPLRQLEIERQQLLEKGLAQLVEQRLLSLEAEARGLSLEALIAQEITSRLGVEAAEVDAFYEANKARISQPKEQVVGQIRNYLEQQAAQSQRSRLLTELKARHKVSVLLEPFRAPLPPSTATVATRGGEQAPVTLTIFSDFQCPGCRGIEPVLDSVREAYGEKLQVVFRQYPLTSIHPQAFQAAEAALCAGDQGKFWEMHGALFADQRRLARADLDRRATDLGLDQGTFGACLDSGEKKTLVEGDMRLGREIGVSGTPALFVNGRPIDLTNLQGSPQDAISLIIEDELGRSAS